jgi:hypothetical protein
MARNYCSVKVRRHANVRDMKRTEIKKGGYGA